MRMSYTHTMIIYRHFSFTCCEYFNLEQLLSQKPKNITTIVISMQHR